MGQDPDIRYTKSGAMIANFSVGVNQDFKKDGDWVKKTEWVRCAAFGKLAESVSKIKKGDQVAVTGRLETREYEKNGQKCYGTTVVLTEFPQVNRKNDQQNSTQQNNQPAHDDFDDQDIPF